MERLCSPGQLLQAGGTQCFTLSDMSSVWVLVNIYQNDVAYVHVGEDVTIDNETYPGHGARQDSICRAGARSHHAHAAGAHRSLQSRRAAEERHVCDRGSARRDVFQTRCRFPMPPCCATPKTCRTCTSKPANNQFARRMVTLGDSQGGKTQVLTGLQAGDKIVGDGSLFLQFQNSLQR